MVYPQKNPSLTFSRTLFDLIFSLDLFVNPSETQKNSEDHSSLTKNHIDSFTDFYNAKIMTSISGLCKFCKFKYLLSPIEETRYRLCDVA